MRQMAEAKDAAVADAIAPLQEQLQVWQARKSMLNRQLLQAEKPPLSV